MPRLPARLRGAADSLHRDEGWIPLLAVVLCAVVLIRGAWVTSDLAWPQGVDQLRDIAFAESFVRGEPLSDPYFTNQWLWYPPLFPWLVGTAALIADVPASLANARIGAYLNAFSPIAFYALVSLWFGRRAGLASLCAFLFLDRGAYWLAPTYSPWLMSGPSSQGLLFAGLIALTSAVRQPSLWRWGVVGALLGLTFLGHTAPAILLGALAVVGLAAQAVANRTFFGPARFLLLMLAAAAVVGSPLLASIAGHYGLQIRNAAGLRWVDPALGDPLWKLLMPGRWGFLLAAIALFGVICLLVTRRQRAPASILATSWIALSLLLFVQHMRAVTGLPGAGLPGGPVFSPPHHFFFYLQAGLLVAFGVGFERLSSLLRGLIDSAVARAGRLAVLGRLNLFAILIGALLASNGGAWWRRAEFTSFVTEARALYAPVQWRALIGWLRYRTSPDDVFMAADSPALSIVGPTGRKIVALDKFFANPYVDLRPRVSARRLFWEALGANDCRSAAQFAGRYGVTYVVHNRSAEIRPGTCGLQTVFEIPGVRIDRLR